jgi:two-component system aerobic respiration control sensor histidine kinase ArcB
VEVVIDIEDTGVGIPEAELDKIFAMYYQVKSDTDNLHAVGTGIGLAVSKQLMNMMNGDISVSSEVGYGSTFTVSFVAPLINDAMLETEQSLGEQKHLNIFMVEDIELNVTVARSLLESLGHSVTVAMTGQAALDTFIPEKFDLAFLDIQLPDMTGFDVVHTIRERYADQHLPPLVALTANVLKDKSEYLRKGMDDVISKPLSVAAIKEVIEKQMHQHDRVESEIHKDDDVAVCDEPVADQSEQEYRKVLDLDMLMSYVEIVGPAPVLDSIEMFEDMMPGYLDILDSNMMAKDQAAIVSEAHKIKGAAGSIGLARIQKVAQKAQTPDAPAWWENISDWVEEIKNEYQKDIQLLKQWLANREG